MILRLHQLIIKVHAISFFLLISLRADAQLKDGITTLNIDTFTILNNLKIAEGIYKQYPDSAYKIAESAFIQSRNLNYRTGLRQALYRLGMINYNNKNFEIALQQLKHMMRYCDSSNKKELFYGNYVSGYILDLQGNYRKALSSYYKVFSYTYDKTSAQEACLVYYNIANILKQLYEFQKAIVYYNKAIDCGKATQYNNLSKMYAARGQAFLTLKQYKEAESDLDSAMHYAQNPKDYNETIYNLSLKADLYLTINNLSQAKKIIEEAEAIIHNYTLTDSSVITSTYIVAGDIYTSDKQYKKAEKYYLKASKLIDDAQEFSTHNFIVVVHRLSDLYYKSGDYKSAYVLHMQSHNLLDSIKHAEVHNKANEFETKFRTAEKDKIIVQNKLTISEQEKSIMKHRLWIILLSSGALTLVGITTSRYLFVRQKNKRLQSEQEVLRLKAIMEGEEKERKRLSHELHDGINSQIAATQSYLLAVQQAYPNLLHSQEFKKVKEMLSSTSSEIRHVAHNLAPDELMKKGLDMAIREFCYNIFADGKTNIEIQTFGDFEQLTHDLALTIYRIIQELLHNIKKHAAATDVILMLVKNKEEITLTIEDNGVGIPENILYQKEKNGIGLSGIKERVETINGTLQIDMKKNGGTMFNIVFKTYSSSKNVA